MGQMHGRQLKNPYEIFISPLSGATQVATLTREEINPVGMTQMTVEEMTKQTDQIEICNEKNNTSERQNSDWLK